MTAELFNEAQGPSSPVIVPLIENKVMSKLVRTIFTNILTVKINGKQKSCK